jgi:N-acetylglucosamine-6-phosphate deacetylase
VSAVLLGADLVPGDCSLDDDGRLDAVGLRPAPGGRLAVPGLVDLQVNGFDGVDLMGADAAQLRQVGRSLLRHGVTAYLPTLITAAPADTDAALDVLARCAAQPAPADGARMLGVHLEGPFLSPARTGTHPLAHRRDPDLELLRSWCDRAPVVAVTLAPELSGALELVRELVARGLVVSVGHSDATAAQAGAAFDAGASTVTHLWNAMSPLQARAPGVPGAALSRPDVVVQLVLDGHHLAPEVVRLSWAAARSRVVLVTDATAASARPDGRYELAGVPLEVRAGAVRNPDGDLAGSAPHPRCGRPLRRRARRPRRRGARRRDRHPPRPCSVAPTSAPSRSDAPATSWSSTTACRCTRCSLAPGRASASS